MKRGAVTVLLENDAVTVSKSGSAGTDAGVYLRVFGADRIELIDKRTPHAGPDGPAVAPVAISYTPDEGGAWRTWPVWKATPTTAALDREPHRESFRVFGTGRTDSPALAVHAIEFADGRIWDSWNGWRL